MIVIGVAFVAVGVINFFSKTELKVEPPKSASASYRRISLDVTDLTFGTQTSIISSATFGADFYTYIYRGVVKVVSALDVISSQLSASSIADQAIYDGLKKTVDAQNESNKLLESNYKEVNQLSQISYELGINQIEQNRYQNTIILLGIGFVILFYGLLRFGETIVIVKTKDLPSTDNKDGLVNVSGETSLNEFENTVEVVK